MHNVVQTSRHIQLERWLSLLGIFRTFFENVSPMRQLVKDLLSGTVGTVMFKYEIYNYLRYYKVNE